MHLTVAERRPHLIRLGVILGLLCIIQATSYWYSSVYDYESAMGWNWASNFLSDLGRTTWYNGMAAPFAQRLWFLLGMGSLGCSVALWFQGERASRVLGSLAGTAFLGIALLPSDIVRWPHRIALLAALGFTLVAALASWKASWANRALSVLLGGYIVFLMGYPLPETSNATSLTHSLMQKGAILSSVLTIVIGTLPPRKYLREVLKR
jgi:hypothetical membrane protein